MVINVLFKNLDMARGKNSEHFCDVVGGGSKYHIYIFQGFRHCLMVTKNVGNGRFTYRAEDEKIPMRIREAKRSL